MNAQIRLWGAVLLVTLIAAEFSRGQTPSKPVGEQDLLVADEGPDARGDRDQADRRMDGAERREA